MVHGLETLERLNAAPAATQQIKSVVVAHDTDDGFEAIYVDGFWVCCNRTIFTREIIEAVGGPTIPFTLEQQDFSNVASRWPVTLEELRSSDCPPSTSYADGREAALRGCARMIWCGTNAEREAWFAGWDSIASDQRGTWPLTGPVPQ